MEADEPSSRGCEEAGLNPKPILKQPQGISNPPERSQHASDELDTPLDTHVGPVGSGVTDASAATIAATSSCDDAINSPGVSDGIMVSVNPHASTAPDSGGLGDVGNAMAFITEFNTELDRVIGRFQDEDSVSSESPAQGLVPSPTSSVASSSAGAVIPSISILPGSNDNATDSSAANAPAASPAGVAVSSTGNTAKSWAANQPSVSPWTIVPSAVNSAVPVSANTASNIHGMSLDQSSMNDRTRAAKDLIDSIYQAQDTMTTKTLEVKKVREDLHAAPRGLLGDIEAFRKRQDRFKSIFQSIHNRSIDKHRERFNATNEEISTGFEQMRGYAGEFRSSIRKVLNSRNYVHNQVKRVETSITTLQNKVKYIEEIITAIQNQEKRAEESMNAIQNQATGTVASVNALSGRVSEMEQTLTLVPALVRFCA
ncbi:uncharacterized protein FPRO_09026 [Fusarium proliferatum ET1]|uniref:Uncharacterized protein n=1 Tax=Fusarium proliferatum (strain ET1) TaxID=1227346 RepID=A0A1L7W9F7_FUSPR|nr:uncharacterized protein FPRO_09026 [Fusarium proliferatum ET1]CZR49233.1 uncharacterized protein FPRO_09026 [Fusarium proliferatum ET1]